MNLLTTDSRESQPLLLTGNFAQVLNLYPTGGVENQPIFIRLPALIPDACVLLSILPDGSVRLLLEQEGRQILNILADASVGLSEELLAAVSLDLGADGAVELDALREPLRALEQLPLASVFLAVNTEANQQLMLEQDASVTLDVEQDAAEVFDIKADCSVTIEIGACSE